MKKLGWQHGDMTEYSHLEEGNYAMKHQGRYHVQGTTFTL